RSSTHGLTSEFTGAQRTGTPKSRPPLGITLAPPEIAQMRLSMRRASFQCHPTMPHEQVQQTYRPNPAAIRTKSDSCDLLQDRRRLTESLRQYPRLEMCRTTCQ